MKLFTRFLFRIPLMLLAGIALAGCEKQLETVPQQSIDAETALTSREAIEASITASYGRLKSARLYGRDLITHPEALADNGYATNKSGRLVPEANNTAGAANHFTGNVWINSYAAINQINLTLEAIPGIAGATAAEKARWEGQLYFLRGLFYFDLIRVYAYIPGAVVDAQNRGGVPLTLRGFSTVDSALAFKPARAPIDDVYTQIVSDLQQANNLLTFPGLGINLANKAAAQLLLARVNLYRKNFTDAKRWSDSVINIAGSRLTNTTNHVANWRTENHNETLFQVRFATNAENIGVNESLQTSFTTLGTVGNPAVTVGFGDLVPTLGLLNELGITLVGGNNFTNYTGANAAIADRSPDVRNLLYEPGTTGRGKSYIETTKYMGKNGFPNLDNVPVLRIAEAYLIRAEAQATEGSAVFDEAAARADLKMLKSNRYTGYAGSAIEIADDALAGTELLEEILRQRRIEFAFEGHRFFDLKRLGRDILKSLPTGAIVQFTDIRILPAIPQVEIDANPNLKQNPGY
ncbi:MAG TPA: RagB/SusD family nutrient uptake outer membrane protein [Chitinophagaceae bacterium]|jgi:hypothetical protein|nr:RagB/SusD family nutrient uptake outer membrane protein [Chitinophagaceae bacterium]